MNVHLETRLTGEDCNKLMKQSYIFIGNRLKLFHYTGRVSSLKTPHKGQSGTTITVIALVRSLCISWLSVASADLLCDIAAAVLFLSLTVNVRVGCRRLRHSNGHTSFQNNSRMQLLSMHTEPSFHTEERDPFKMGFVFTNMLKTTRPFGQTCVVQN